MKSNMTAKKIFSFIFVFLILNSFGLYGQGPVFKWAKQISSSGTSHCNELITDAAGNVFVTGAFSGVADMDPGPGVINFTAMSSPDMFISRFDTAFNLVWARHFPGAAGYALALDGSGNVLVTGGFYATVDFDPGSTTFNLV